MVREIVRADKGGLGAEPPAGSRGWAPGQRNRGAKPPEAEARLAFRRLMKAANLSIFLKYGNAKKSDICVIIAKKLWVAMKLAVGSTDNLGC